MASWVLPSDAEDREILDATRRADPSAFDLLYRNYSAAVRSLCRKLLSDNTAAADDACQETMLKAYQALPRFRPGARIWPWLSTIARNVCTDMHRDRQRVIVCAEPQVQEVSPGPEEIAASRTRVRILRASLRRVERRQRMYVYLRDAFGWSYEQIADFDHTTVPAVRSVLHRGRSTLRDTVVTVARERHEWPLPAFLPVWWLRARVRASQARDWAANWLSRLDPATAVGAVVGSTAFVNASIAALGIAGVGGALAPNMAESSPKFVRAPVPVVAAASAATELPSRTVGAPAAPAPGATSSPQPAVSVEVDPSMQHHREAGRDIYTLSQADGAARPTEENKAVDFGAGVGVACPRPEERPPLSAVACPVLADMDDD